MPQSERRPRQTVWRKSSYSISVGECIEAISIYKEVGVRDSSNPDLNVMNFSFESWRKFIEDIKSMPVD
jgi:hypothetical protein